MQTFAAGEMLRKIATDNTTTPAQLTTTDYVNGLVYQNDTLQFIPHEQGRARLIAETGTTPFLHLTPPARPYPGYPSDNLTNPDTYVAALNAVTGKKVGPSLVLRNGR